MEKLNELRLKVLRHIELHSEGGRFGCSVPDCWIDEAELSVAAGQSTPRWPGGRKLTELGRAALAKEQRE